MGTDKGRDVRRQRVDWREREGRRAAPHRNLVEAKGLPRERKGLPRERRGNEASKRQRMAPSETGQDAKTFTCPSKGKRKAPLPPSRGLRGG